MTTAVEASNIIDRNTLLCKLVMVEVKKRVDQWNDGLISDDEAVKTIVDLLNKDHGEA